MLTKRKCDSAKYDPNGPSQQVVYDGTLPGFVLRLRDSGRKVFIVRYRTRSGRDRLLTIAQYGVATVEEARKRARKALLEVSDGQDPQAERKQARASLTVKEFCKEYLEDYAKHKKKSWREDKRRITTRIEPALATRKLHEVTRADIEKIHVKVGSEGGHAEANRVLALVSKIYSMAAEWDKLPPGFPNPAYGVGKFPEESRRRFVTKEEMPKLIEAVNNEESPHVRGVILLLLFTGCRRSELLSAKWEDVDWNHKFLWLTHTKSGKGQEVPLSTPALQLLQMIPRQQDNPYIFPSTIGEGNHMADIRKPWKRIRDAANLTDVTLHDLRRTVGSWMVDRGASQALVGSVLRHTSLDQTEKYTRIAENGAAVALEEHGQELLETVEGLEDLADSDNERVENND